VCRADILTTLCAGSVEVWEPLPPGNLRACSGLYRVLLTVIILNKKDMFLVDTEYLFCRQKTKFYIKYIRTSIIEMLV
jgi:hypothetical protein